MLKNSIRGGILGTIPQSITKYIFLNFLGSASQNYMTVSKKWNKDLGDIISSTNTQVFYTIGIHVCVSSSSSAKIIQGEFSFFSKKSKAIKKMSLYPCSIDEKNILNSFRKLPQYVKLFRTEEDALEYSRSLRRQIPGSSRIVFQPPLFKIQYVGERKNLTLKTEKISFYRTQEFDLNEDTNDQFLQEMKAGYGCSDKEEEITLSYHLVPKEMIIPLSGTLKIQYNKNKTEQEYAPVLFRAPSKDKDDTQDMGGYALSCVMF